MPVTARLSQKFYEKLGDDLATELVDWFNAVDTTYRTDLRVLNELNFSRFDAKLEQRLVEIDAKWGGSWSELDAKLEQRLAQLDAKFERRLAELMGELLTAIGELGGDTAAVRARAQTTTVMWMFGFWAV